MDDDAFQSLLDLADKTPPGKGYKPSKQLTDRQAELKTLQSHVPQDVRLGPWDMNAILMLLKLWEAQPHVLPH